MAYTFCFRTVNTFHLFSAPLPLAFAHTCCMGLGPHALPLLCQRCFAWDQLPQAACAWTSKASFDTHAHLPHAHTQHTLHLCCHAHRTQRLPSAHPPHTEPAYLHTLGHDGAYTFLTIGFHACEFCTHVRTRTTRRTPGLPPLPLYHPLYHGTLRVDEHSLLHHLPNYPTCPRPYP